MFSAFKCVGLVLLPAKSVPWQIPMFGKVSEAGKTLGQHSAAINQISQFVRHGLNEKK